MTKLDGTKSTNIQGYGATRTVCPIPLAPTTLHPLLKPYSLIQQPCSCLGALPLFADGAQAVRLRDFPTVTQHDSFPPLCTGAQRVKMPSEDRVERTVEEDSHCRGSDEGTAALTRQ